MLQRVQNFIKLAKSLRPKIFDMAETASTTPDILGKREADREDDTNTKNSKKKKKKHIVQLGKDEGCKRKIALLVAYNGAGYYGVQVNPGFPTIESTFFPALVKIGAVPEDHVTTLSKMWFQRGSRTDKGVSAAGQIFSMKAVVVPDFVQKINDNLPPAIRVIGYVRTTNGFDSKKFCTARTYMYMLPTFAFAPIEKIVEEDYRVTSDIVQRVRDVLMKFQGTHKFHNFTSGVKFEEACASRYIIKFECSDPFVRDGLEFVTMRVKGQSFMLHHIRKMIGLTIAIVRGYCGDDVIENCWGPQRVDVPKAPGLGLVLEQLHFDGYNKKFGSNGVHEPIDWTQYQNTIEKFKEEQIISQIVTTEKEEKVTLEWLRTLQFHTFDTQRIEGPEKPWAPVKKWLDGKVDLHPSEILSSERNKAEGEGDQSSLTQQKEDECDNDTSQEHQTTNAVVSGQPIPCDHDEESVAIGVKCQQSIVDTESAKDISNTPLGTNYDLLEQTPCSSEAKSFEESVKT